MKTFGITFWNWASVVWLSMVLGIGSMAFDGTGQYLQEFIQVQLKPTEVTNSVYFATIRYT